MANKILKTRIQNAVYPEAQWSANDPVLQKGELAFSSDKGYVYKVGDGTSKWSALSYAPLNFLPLAGGTLTGNLSGQHITGTWLRSTANNASVKAATKICIQDSKGWIYTRTPAQILSDIGITATAAELNYVDGVTSNIQTQFTNVNTKLNSTIKDLSISGKVITYTKTDGSTGTLTTQDTNTTYSVMTGASSSTDGKSGLVPQPTKGNQGKYLRGDGTWAVPTDTKNTAGSTNSSLKLFLIGANSQSESVKTYSNSNVYILSTTVGSGDSAKTYYNLYSNGIQVVNLSDSQALSNKTYNGYTLGAACAKGVTDSTSAGAISTGTNLVTERDVYYGLPTINGSHSYTSGTNIYAPTTVGASSYILKSNGSGAPTWTDQSSITAGRAQKWLEPRNFIIKDHDSTNSSSRAVLVDGSEDITLLLPSKIKAALDGNASTATSASKWTTARNFIIKDHDSTNDGTAVSVDGSEAITLLLPSNIKATLNGNASTATKLKTARTIELTGSVTGSGTFDGSGNLSIDTTTKHNHDSLYVKKSGDTMTISQFHGLTLNRSNTFGAAILFSNSNCSLGSIGFSADKTFVVSSESKTTGDLLRIDSSSVHFGKTVYGTFDGNLIGTVKSTANISSPPLGLSLIRTDSDTAVRPPSSDSYIINLGWEEANRCAQLAITCDGLDDHLYLRTPEYIVNVDSSVDGETTSTGAYAWNNSSWLSILDSSNYNQYALSLTGGTVSGTLKLSNTNDLSGTAYNSPALVIGDPTAVHIEFDTNEIHAKATETTVGSLYLNNDGGPVIVGGGGLHTIGIVDSTYLQSQFIELISTNPFIDFHFNKSTADYTSRIIESKSGYLDINGVLCSSNICMAGEFGSKDATWRVGMGTGSGNVNSWGWWHSKGGLVATLSSTGDIGAIGAVWATGYNNRNGNATAIWSYPVGSPHRIDILDIIGGGTSSYYIEAVTIYGAYGISCWQSDIHLKNNIKPTDVQNALSKINQIDFMQFDWKIDNEHCECGIIADQIENIIPNSVMNVKQPEDSEYEYLKQINSNQLTVYGLKAIQELSTQNTQIIEKVESVEERVKILEKENSILRDEIQQLKKYHI